MNRRRDESVNRGGGGGGEKTRCENAMINEERGKADTERGESTDQRRREQ